MITLPNPIQKDGGLFALQEKDYQMYADTCSNWNVLQMHIKEMSPEQLLIGMAVEKHGRNRINILSRLYARYANMRREEERRKLLS